MKEYLQSIRVKYLKTAVAIIAVISLIIGLIPEKLEFDDGGTTAYKAVFYSVTDYNAIIWWNDDDGESEEDEEIQYYTGRVVKILNYTVYDTTPGEWYLF